MNLTKIKFLVTTKLRRFYRQVINPDFWKQVGREIRIFFVKLAKTIGILRPSEKRVIIILSIIVLVCAIILFRNYYLTETTLNPKRGGTYTEGMVGTVKYLNPLLARTEIDRGISRVLFLSLVANNDKGQLQPLLAREFSITENGKRYNFILDDKIKWQDGEAVTSDDVAFTLTMLQAEGYTGPFKRSFENVQFEKKSDTEFSLILAEANSSFSTVISELGILPVHKLGDIKAEELDKTEFNLNPVGSGRYCFDSKNSKLNSDGEIVLKKAETYRKDELGYFDEIVFRPYATSAEVIEAYRKGEISGFGGITEAEINTIDRKSFRAYQVLIPRFTAVFLNLERENIKELKFRTILAHAVDRPRIISEVYSNNCESLKSPLSSFVSGYNPEAKDYIYHPPTSEVYLNEMKLVDTDKDGWREKNGKKLELLVYTTDDPALQKTAEIVISDWEKLGVKTNLVVIDLLTLQKIIIPSGQYDVVILGENMDYPPDPYPYFHSSQIKSGLNISAYKNLAVDTLLENARMTTEPQVREEKLKKFSSLVAQDLPAVFICNAPFNYGSNVSVKGITKKRIGESSADRFLDIGSWYIKTERVQK